MIQSEQLSNLVFPFQGKMIDEKKNSNNIHFRRWQIHLHLVSYHKRFTFNVCAKCFIFYDVFFFLFISFLYFGEWVAIHWTVWFTLEMSEFNEIAFHMKNEFQWKKKLTFDIHTLKMASDMFGERKKKLEQRFWAN